MSEILSGKYYTIAATAQGLYKEKGSKFIGSAYPVYSETEIKTILTQLHQEYYDAAHHCFAYILGATGAIYRANDDGEPNHSAGTPILGQIRSAGLTNILVVVVRYFGGTKLGVSGLIQAYKTTAAETIAAAQIIERIESISIKVTFAYDLMNFVMNLIKEYKLVIEEQNFGLSSELSLAGPKNIFEAVTKQLAGKATIEII